MLALSAALGCGYDPVKPATSAGTVVFVTAPTDVYAGQPALFKAIYRQSQTNGRPDAEGFMQYSVGVACPITNDLRYGTFPNNGSFVVDQRGLLNVAVPVDTDAIAVPVCATWPDISFFNDPGGTSKTLVTFHSRVQQVAVTPGSVTLTVGEKLSLTPTVTLVPGTPNSPAPVVTWSSSAPTVATVDAAGTVTAVAVTTPQTVTITARAEGIKFAVPVTVNPASASPVATSITLLVNTGTGTRSVNTGGETVTIGSTLTLLATVRDQTGAALPEAATWTSSNPSVATVDAATGVVTAKASGSATITAASTSKPSVTNTVAVTVSAPAGGTATSMTIAPTSATVKDGSQQQFIATLRDAAGNPTTPPAGGVIAYAVDASAIATVSANGLVQAFSAGTTTVRAFLVVNGQSTNIAASATLTVTP